MSSSGEKLFEVFGVFSREEGGGVLGIFLFG